MANTRTNRLLTPYKGYSILRSIEDGWSHYYAHKAVADENDWIAYMYNVNLNGPDLHANSLRDIKNCITADINAGRYIDIINAALKGG